MQTVDLNMSCRKQVNNQWKTGERIDQNRFDQQMAVIDAGIKAAEAQKDRNLQTTLTDAKFYHELQMQTQDFTQQENGKTQFRS